MSDFLRGLCHTHHSVFSELSFHLFFCSKLLSLTYLPVFVVLVTTRTQYTATCDVRSLLTQYRHHMVWRHGLTLFNLTVHLEIYNVRSNIWAIMQRFDILRQGYRVQASHDLRWTTSLLHTKKFNVEQNSCGIIEWLYIQDAVNEYRYHMIWGECLALFTKRKYTAHL